MDEPCPQHGEALDPYVMQAAARPAAKALGPSFLAPEELASRALDEGTELALLRHLHREAVLAVQASPPGAWPGPDWALNGCFPYRLRTFNRLSWP